MDRNVFGERIDCGKLYCECDKTKVSEVCSNDGLGATASENQKAILRKLTEGYYLVRCSSGWALWKRDIEWSQGRTPSNAVHIKDFNFLIKENYLQMTDKCMGVVCLTNKGYEASLESKGDFTPASDGYKGPAFC